MRYRSLAYVLDQFYIQRVVYKCHSVILLTINMKTSGTDLDKNTLRQLRIKTGIVSRISKDISSYKDEAEIQQQRLERMKREGQDEYDIMKMGQVVQESLMMVPHCVRKLVTANADLEEFLETLPECDEDTEAEQTEAVTMILKARRHCRESKTKIKDHEDSSTQGN